MTAKDLYTALSAKYVNHYFGSYEELNLILDGAEFPCVVVIPISKQVSFIADRFKVVETVVIASLDQMELDFETEQIYDEVLIKERELLANIFDFMPKIRSVQNLSELNKFDQNVIFAAMSIELVNDHVNCKI
jgi:hypothetical protein